MRRFPEASGEGERPSVCIVTSELVGPFNNGGIGTSMTGLAICLAEAGFPVTILYTGGKFTAPAELDRWRGLYAGIGIEVDWIRHEAAAGLAGPVAGCGFTAPWLVYLYLRERSFDVVQFNDCMGDGFYCLAMKRLGAGFADTAMFVALHSPSQWIFEINRTLPDSLLFAAFNHAERLSVRAADLLWFPSRYLFEWIRAHGFVPPEAAYHQKYALPPVPMFGAGDATPPRARSGRGTAPRSGVVEGKTEAALPLHRPSDGPPPRDKLGEELTIPSEIVFFGRLEERKGLRLFCQALRLIEPLLLERGTSIAFLGKAGMVGSQPALDFLEEEARGWRFPWRMLTNLGQQEAVDHLRVAGRLAVIASPADNSPCTVYEALAYRIPFIAARTGGIPELIAPEDGEPVLFDYDSEALADRLREALERGLVPARPAEDPAETRRRWIGGFERWRDFAGGSAQGGAERRLRVLVDGADEADLAATIDSLDQPEVERVMLVERSWRGPVPPGLDLIPPDRPGRLSEALGDSPGEAVLLLRAGTVLRPGGARRIVEALRGPAADGLIPAAALAAPDGERAMPPLGGSPSFCLFEGAAPAGALAVKADRLARAVGDRRTAPDAEHLGLADLAVAAGLELWPYAEPLVGHPQGFVADGRSRRAPERFAAYAAASETERYYMAAIGYGGFAPGAGLGGLLRGVRERMVMRRLGWLAALAARAVPRRLAGRLRRR